MFESIERALSEVETELGRLAAQTRAELSRLEAAVARLDAGVTRSLDAVPQLTTQTETRLAGQVKRLRARAEALTRSR